MGLRSFIHKLTAPVVELNVPIGNYKLALIVNSSLKMKKGKIAAQVGHGAVKSALRASSNNPSLIQAWMSSGQAKICLKANSEEALLDLEKQAVKRGLQTVKVRDAGRTQIPANSLTVVGIGPALVEDLDLITGDLKLL